MKGTVTMINPTRGMAAAETDEGFTVFEICEVTCSLDVGDEVSGPLDSLGSERLYNVTKKENMDTFIQDIQCGVQRAIELLS